ncbi:hypothetical protein E2542_SST23964 [Spatholobus suberectus]|nr:hypothetical protein E2542_SST23964 [Spatholobus suberectus]
MHIARLNVCMNNPMPRRLRIGSWNEQPTKWSKFAGDRHTFNLEKGSPCPELELLQGFCDFGV